MPSLITGYEYDIFISYRQKDNKHDGWVTEFVENLKGELESTFKEEISVYYDINPHDGLLETHDVDESLKEKLKCLVFIPIISRTYCDTKSFAWEHEFKEFVEQASNDKFGLKVKLPNGNVESRVLPVQIHELDNEDINLCESVLKGVLRGIEFIYKSAGVNRPLLPKEENPQDNLNRTNYRDQINKVANAIKDIITAIQHYSPQKVEVSQEGTKPIITPQKSKKTPIILGLVIALAVIILGILFVPKLFKPAEELEKSIAVLPFKYLSDEPDKQYLADGMMDAILLHLSKIEDLRVMDRTSVEQYRETTKTTLQISKELDVVYLLEGSFQKYEDNVRLIVQLIKASEKGHVWANEYNNKWSEIFSVQSDVAQTIAKELNAAITPEEQQLIEKTPTTSLTAFDFFQKGREEHWKYWLKGDTTALENAEEFYYKALEYDSAFAQAYTGLAWVYWNKHYWEAYLSEDFLDSVLVLTDIALTYDDQLSEAYTFRGEYYSEMEKTEQAIKEFDKAIKLNPNDWLAYWGKGQAYSDIDKVKTIENLLKAVSLHRGSALPGLLGGITVFYWNTGFMEKAKYYNEERFKLDKNSIGYYWSLANIEYCSGNYEDAIEYLERAYALDTSDTDIHNIFGQFYMMTGNYEKTLEHLQKWIVNSDSMSAAYLFGMHRVGWAYWQSGYKIQGEYYLNKQIDYCNRMKELERVYGENNRIYYDLAGAYAFMGEKEKAYENLRSYRDSQTLPGSWTLQLIRDDPLLDNLRDEPEFQQIVRDVEARYQAEHERVRKWLEENGEL